MMKDEYFDFFRSCLSNDTSVDCNEAIKLAHFSNLSNNEVIKAAVMANNIKKINERDRNNRETYNYLLTDYKKILEKTTTLAKELKLKNSLEFSMLYTYLLWSGYFSKDKKIEFTLDGRHNISGLYSLDVITGKGVCLNFSELLKDFLNNSGFYSAIIASTQTYKNKILQKARIKKEKMTHASNLIIEHGKLYVYDSTNFYLLELENINSAMIIAGARSFKYKYMYKYKLYPYESYYLNFSTKSVGVLDIFHRTNDMDSPYDSEIYTKTHQDCIEKFHKNKNLLSDYYDCTKENIDFISKKLSYK